MAKQNRGPKTKNGKAAVSKNAVKHGIMSSAPVVDKVESMEEWQRFRQGVIDSLAPEGVLEEDLAEDIAALRWRKRRIRRYETAIITRQVKDTEEQLAVADAYIEGRLAEGTLYQIEPERLAEAWETRLMPNAPALDNILRYEAAFHREWLQLQHELEAMQARRLGKPGSLHRVDFSSPPRGVGGGSLP